MQISFLTVLIAVVSLVILAVPGFLLVKSKLMSTKAESALSTLVLYGAQPVMVFMSFQSTSFNARIGVNVLIVAGLTLVIHLLMAGIMILLVKNKGDKAKRNVVKYASIFSNAGFMGFPFLQIVFAGSPFLGEAMIYAAVLVSIFLFINWTLGVYLISGNVKDISFKKIILNPTIIAIFIGFILFFTVKVPFIDLTKEGTNLNLIVSKLMASLDVIGDMVTPVSMTVIGMKLASANFKDLFLDKWGYLVCLFKLVVMSLLTMLCVSFLPIAETIKYVFVFLLSMPCATSTALLPILYGGDAKSGSAYVLLSCLACVVTIPLMFLLFTLII